ncbi:F-box/kelch-repeat protein At1g15670-like [Impatiens glandulifera]|uniref:F-box/kelch-repeat protein At1g15670-like n=1 Tax=Impatiens glandulifera TaxID=253017 RepID=UPI001FB1296F|nr:F-box/kelch-repeat protein At1g15670-like [Impatiens glandulifera]
MELVPGLPYFIGLECLFRVSFDQFPTLTLVCRRWKQEISSRKFLNLRKVAGFSQPVVVMVQARPEPERKLGYSFNRFRSPTYRVTLCDIKTGIWRELPRVPWFSHGLPLFCQVVVVGFNLVVMGGKEPMTWVVSREVSVYNFLTGLWTRGTPMPGCQRSFFACASDEDNYVFVAGGCDDENKALRSAMVYDVASDLWALLPDMEMKRVECKGVFHEGKFHVIGGYEVQGRFEKSANVYNVATLKWEPVENECLIVRKCPKNCFSGGDGKMYMCLNNDVTFTENDKFNWRCLTQVPTETRSTIQITGGLNMLFAIGSSGLGEPHKAYVFDLASHEWNYVAAPEEFVGHVQSCCWLNI